MAIVKCAWCGKEKEVWESVKKKSERHFCNVKCLGAYKTAHKKWVETNCEFCGKKIRKNPYEIKRNKHHFCSNQCAREFSKKRVTFPCDWCGKPVEYPECHADRSEKHFCDANCQGEWKSRNQIGENNPNYSRVTTKCFTCGIEITVKKSQYERNKKCFCGRRCAVAFLKSDENRKLQRKRMLKTLSKYPRRTKPEKMMYRWLQELKTPFQEQVVINDKFCVDFLVPANKVIEVFGDYFHANPMFYGNELKPIDSLQRKNLLNDKRKIAYLSKCGYEILVVWENDMYKNPDGVIEEVNKFIN